MKVFDCTTFYSENLMLDVRFNVLDKFVDKFVITEALYSHSGDKKKLNFNINNYKDFKKKIIYIPVNNEPEDIIYNSERDNVKTESNSNARENAIKRISYQRDKLTLGLEEADDNDYIFYSDNDEIPKYQNINLEETKSKIIIFKQKLFCYKFNLLCDRTDWFGTKGCKKKDLKSFSWLREIKGKSYPKFRLDTLFSKNKYTNVNIVNDGGWHFSQLKSPEDIKEKLTNDENHFEHKLSMKQMSTIEDMIKRKVINYDHKANSTAYKYSKEFKLKTLSLEHMPLYIQNNLKKYSEWFDLEV